MTQAGSYLDNHTTCLQAKGSGSGRLPPELAGGPEFHCSHPRPRAADMCGWLVAPAVPRRSALGRRDMRAGSGGTGGAGGMFQQYSYKCHTPT